MRRFIFSFNGAMSFYIFVGLVLIGMGGYGIAKGFSEEITVGFVSAGVGIVLVVAAIAAMWFMRGK